MKGEGLMIAMDQHFATVLIALISAVVTVLTTRMRRNSEEMLKRMNDTTSMIEEENELKKNIEKTKRAMEDTLYQIQILIVDTNMYMISDNHEPGRIASLNNRSEELKELYASQNEEFNGYLKEYEMLLKYNDRLKTQIAQNKKGE